MLAVIHMVTQMLRDPRTGEDSPCSHWRQAPVRHRTLKLRTMSHMTARQAKQLFNHANVVRHETPAQDGPCPVASDLCTLSPDTVWPTLGSVSFIAESCRSFRTW